MNSSRISRVPNQMSYGARQPKTASSAASANFLHLADKDDHPKEGDNANKNMRLDMASTAPNRSKVRPNTGTYSQAKNLGDNVNKKMKLDLASNAKRGSKMRPRAGYATNVGDNVNKKMRLDAAVQKNHTNSKMGLSTKKWRISDTGAVKL